MISIVRSFPVNQPGQAKLDRSEVWTGLEDKARNAPRFVKRMQSCTVIEEHPDGITRDIVIRDEHHRERVTFDPGKTVRFDRIDGPTIGHITNEIVTDDDGNLILQFGFNLERKDMAAGSAEEKAYFAVVEREYEDAVRTTLETMRDLHDAESSGAAEQGSRR
jgi:Domain of unknown function (DUF1857)